MCYLKNIFHFLLIVFSLLASPCDAHSYQYSIEWDSTGAEVGHVNNACWFGIFNGGPDVNPEFNYDPEVWIDWYPGFKILSNKKESFESALVNISFDITAKSQIFYEKNGVINSANAIFEYYAHIGPMTFTKLVNMSIFSAEYIEKIVVTVPLDTNTWYGPIFYVGVKDHRDCKVDFQPSGNYLTYEIGWLGAIRNLQVSIAPVPEPTTILLFGIGLAGLTDVGRKKRK